MVGPELASHYFLFLYVTQEVDLDVTLWKPKLSASA